LNIPDFEIKLLDGFFNRGIDTFSERNNIGVVCSVGFSRDKSNEMRVKLVNGVNYFDIVMLRENVRNSTGLKRRLRFL
jgi:hypothetical protein